MFITFSTDVFRWGVPINVNGEGPVNILNRLMPSFRKEEDRPCDPPICEESVIRDIAAVGVGLLWATDETHHLNYLSQRALGNLPNEGAGLLGQSLLAIFAEESEGLAPAEKKRSLRFRVTSHLKIEDMTVRVEPNCPDGGASSDRVRWWRISGYPFFDNEGEFTGYRGTFVDVSEQYDLQQRAVHDADSDELTDLSNRRRISRRLGDLMPTLDNGIGACALLTLDLDHFKQINDTLGHAAGDQLLRQVATRLKSIAGPGFEVGRIGGDEFQIIVPGIDDRGELSALASRIVHMVSQPYLIAERRCIIGTSVGIAIAPYDGLDQEALAQASDLALYSAKTAGKGTYRFYTAELSENASRSSQLELGLQEAIDNGDFTLEYQPLISPLDDCLRGVEALMRWNHPQWGPVSPETFIAIAEQSDLILRLGEWCLHQACNDAANWPSDAYVAVNVSPRQFLDANFVNIVKSALERSGISPKRLELEFTESVFVGNLSELEETFADLKSLGVKLVMDDFGIGYASLGYLKKAPFDKIKIDRSFVRGCTHSDDPNAAIIAAIVALADALRVHTVAEGVEALDELNFLKDRGIDLIQGWIYSRALSQDAFIAQISDGSLKFPPQGPARSRADRKSVYRNVRLIHQNHIYDAILRNISRSGARIEGFSEIPVGSDLVMDLGGGQLVVCSIANSDATGQGLAFEAPLIDDGNGELITRHRVSPFELVKAGLPIAPLGSGFSSR